MPLSITSVQECSAAVFNGGFKDKADQMPFNKHFYKPAEGHGLKHDPFKAIIAPRPIGWISTLSKGGVANLAPYSFFNAFNNSPPIIGFSSIGYKDTVKNIEETGEFCWNLVSEDLMTAMNITSAPLPEDSDEFELAFIEKGESSVVKSPHVLNSPVIMECKKTQIVQLEDHSGEQCEAFMVLGEVVGVHIQQDVLNDGVYSTVAAKPIMRAGGAGDYFKIDEAQKFVMFRPD